MIHIPGSMQCTRQRTRRGKPFYQGGPLTTILNSRSFSWLFCMIASGPAGLCLITGLSSGLIWSSETVTECHWGNALWLCSPCRCPGLVPHGSRPLPPPFYGQMKSKIIFLLIFKWRSITRLLVRGLAALWGGGAVRGI